MEVYSITQIAERLSLKVHTIRYWEKNVPMLSAVERDEYGKRLYNNNDCYMLMRLKYYIEERHFTLKGAAEALLQEMSDDTNRGRKKDVFDIMQKLEMQRSRLEDAKNILKSMPEKNNGEYNDE